MFTVSIHVSHPSIPGQKIAGHATTCAKRSISLSLEVAPVDTSRKLTFYFDRALIERLCFVTTYHIGRNR